MWKIYSDLKYLFLLRNKGRNWTMTSALYLVNLFTEKGCFYNLNSLNSVSSNFTTPFIMNSKNLTSPLIAIKENKCSTDQISKVI